MTNQCIFYPQFSARKRKKKNYQLMKEKYFILIRKKIHFPSGRIYIHTNEKQRFFSEKKKGGYNRKKMMEKKK